MLDPRQEWLDIQSTIAARTTELFPVEGKKHRLELRDVHWGDPGQIQDINAQLQARLNKRTWAAPMYGTLRLVDIASGKALDEAKDAQILSFPQVTPRFSYIVNGREHQVLHQRRLKAGIYGREKTNGEIEAIVNAGTGRGFKLNFNPASHKFMLAYGTSHLPIYPILKALGVSDEDMQHAWGKALYVDNKIDDKGRALTRLHTLMFDVPAGGAVAAEAIKGEWERTTLRPDVTRVTLGKEFTHVNGDALLRGAEKMLKISRGETPSDHRDSLVFQELLHIPEFISDRMKALGWKARRRVLNTLDDKTKVREVFTPSFLTEPLRSFFSDSALAEQSAQTNPVDFLAGATKLTVLGDGGIGSTQQVSLESKMVDASHIGILDPVQTPEGDRAGISLYLTFGAKKIGRDPATQLINVKTGERETLTANQMETTVIGFPDDFVKHEGKYVPRAAQLRAVGKGNVYEEVPAARVTHIIPDARSMFSPVTALSPFIGSTSGNRLEMVARQMEQAISLKNREVPLVQVYGSPDGTLEDFYGRITAARSPVEGTVTKITPERITVKDEQGKRHDVGLYDRFPLNDHKSFLTSTSIVKVGDRVKADQPLADSNYTVDGTLALGLNARVAYLSWKGQNFEDAIVVSESFAKRLTSLHMHEQVHDIGETGVVDKKKYRALYPDKMTPEQAAKLDNSGVITEGTVVQQGDVLVAGLVKRDPRYEDLLLSGIHRSLNRPYADNALIWEGAPGVVSRVVRQGDSVRVYVNTEEPAQTADKLCFDEKTEVLTRTGWKSIADVTCADEVCSLVTGKIRYAHPTDVYQYPRGGRMYRIRTQQVDLFVTANHCMYVASPRDKTFVLQPAHELYGKHVRYAKAGTWEGESVPEGIALPPMPVRAGQSGHGVRLLPEVSLPLNVYLRLLGAFLSDGSVFDQPGTYGIDFNKNPHKTHLLRQTLTEAGIHYVATDETTCCRTRVYSKQLMEHFRQFGHAHDKFIPNWVFFAAPPQLHTLFTWLVVLGDGHVKDGRPISYSTVSKQLADDVQRLCLHLGFAANIKRRIQDRYTLVNGRQCHSGNFYDVRIVTTKLTPAVNHAHAHEQHVQEEAFVEDYAGPVYCVTVPGHVLYVRRNGTPVWSGNSFRYGNKGVIGKIVPDDQMPHDKDGKPVEVILGPVGVGGRMNLGQVLETALSKAALHDGRPIAVKSFESDPSKRFTEVKGHWRTVPAPEGGTREVWVRPHRRELDYLEQVQEELKRRGLTDAEELFDPETGRSLGRVLVGHQYALKLAHQVEHKAAVRSQGAGYEYTANMAPRGGGAHGAQSIGELGLYALLAYGSTANLREMATVKSDLEQDSFWSALQAGEPLPPPRPPFAYDKFVGYLNAMGVDLVKEGNTLRFLPLTNAQILERSAGELERPDALLRAKDLKPEKGGLFDEHITGGVGGARWSHFALTEPIPNPLYENGIRRLLGLSQADYTGLVNGELALTKEGALRPITEGAGLTGGPAFMAMLSKINVAEDLRTTAAALKTAPPSKLDALVKRFKALRALKRAGLAPEEAYLLKNVPVMPPRYRPVSVLPSGDLNWEDLNGLYQQLAVVNKQLAEHPKGLPPETEAPIRAELYGALAALYGLDDKKETDIRGIVEILHGTAPKYSFVQKQLLKRKQDLTARSVVVPDPTLGLDQLGVPRSIAQELYKPFLVRNLVGRGYTVLQAREMVERDVPEVAPILEQEIMRRPVLLKRDPVLHKFGVQAFYPKLIPGLAIHTNPLVTSGYNADFDGDAMSIYVPVTEEAVKEAREMLPSNNIINPATRAPMFQPTLDAQVGLYMNSLWGKGPVVKTTPEAALRDLAAGKIAPDSPVHVNGRETTPGRLRLAEGFTSAAYEDLRERVLYDKIVRFDKKGLRAILADAAERPGPYVRLVDHLKTVGYERATQSGWGFSLEDFKVLKDLRAKVFVQADRLAAQTKDMPPAQRESRLIDIYNAADKDLEREAKVALRARGNRLMVALDAGVKPTWTQMKQMLITPMLVSDEKGRPIPVPLRSAFGEGMRLADYWIAASGARKGVINKVLEVQAPGAFTKQIANLMMDTTITEKDCGTKHGISLDVKDPEVVDRYLAASVRDGKMTVPTGTVLTPELAGRLVGARIGKVVVRSSLHCQSHKGICQKCYGLLYGGRPVGLGTNVGLLATHSFGEPATQAQLRVFHLGGVGRKASALSAFEHVRQLLKMPEILPNAAALAEVTGKVTRIEKDPAGGHNVYVSDMKHYVPQQRELLVRAGAAVEKGAPLSDGVTDPRQLLRLRGMPVTQNFIAGELYNAYQGEGVRRRHAEVITRTVTGLARVVNAGDHPDIVRNDLVPLHAIQAWNEQNRDKKPALLEPVLKGVDTLPLDLQQDVLGKFMYRRIGATLEKAVLEGGESELHGTHPVPGLMYGAEFGKGLKGRY